MNKEDQILSAIKKMDDRIERIEDRIDKLDDRIDKLEIAIEKMDDRIDKLEIAIEKLTENQLIFAETQKQTMIAIEKLTGRVEQLEGRMGRVETALSRMDDRLLLQQKNIADLTECVKHLDTQTEENVRYISALMKGQENMEETVRNNHDAICSRLDFFQEDFKNWKDITAQHSVEIMYLKRTAEKIAQ